jgi:hypothetical protein
MGSWGFKIGNHSALYGTIGTIPMKLSIHEALEVREDLQNNLGNYSGFGWLDYPRGKTEELTEKGGDWLMSLVIAFCFSACGGAKPLDFDPLNLLRRGIEHGFTELLLRASAEGLKWQR